MDENQPSVHPKTIIVAVFGYLTAVYIGWNNDSWIGGIAFALFATALAFVFNHIVRRQQSR